MSVSRYRVLYKKFFDNECGFVMIEFIIALPLLVLLLYSIGRMCVNLSTLAREQAIDYALKTDAQTVLERITQDARAATSVTVKRAVGGMDIYEITFVYHSTSDNIFGDGTNPWVIGNISETRRYTVSSAEGKGYHVYSQHTSTSATSPITGDNFFGDTTVTRLEFSEPTDKVLHVTLEIQNAATKRNLRVCTAVYMPSCITMVLPNE